MTINSIDYSGSRVSTSATSYYNDTQICLAAKSLLTLIIQLMLIDVSLIVRSLIIGDCTIREYQCNLILVKLQL